MLDRRLAPVVAAFCLCAVLVPAVTHAQEFGWAPAPDAGQVLGVSNAVAGDVFYVALADGRILAGGGVDASGVDASARTAIYNPDTRQWTLTGNLTKGRRQATAIRMNDGRVIVTGGNRTLYPYSWRFHSLEQVLEPEIFDPATGTWTIGAPASSPRWGGYAIALKDGRVLVAGGSYYYAHPDYYYWYWGGDPSLRGDNASSEIYDPATDTWSTTGNLFWSHAYSGQMYMLGDGRVVMWDTVQWPYLFPEIFDPATNTWNFFWGFETYFSGSAAVLSDGRLIVRGMWLNYSTYTYQPLTRIFDPATNAWQDGPAPPDVRQGDRTMQLPDGTWLFYGGSKYSLVSYGDYQYWTSDYDSTTTVIFNPVTHAWSEGPRFAMADGTPLQNISYSGVGMPLPMSQGRLFYTAGAEYRILHPPVAVGANQTFNGTPGVLGMYTLDGTASHDPDGDAIIDYTWTQNDLVVATGPTPTLLLGVGTHVYSLTVKDATFKTGTTTVTITVRDSAAEAWTAYETCTASLNLAQTALTTATTNLAAANVSLATANATISALQAQLASLQQMMKTALGDPSFVIPGSTPTQQLQNLSTAISTLNPGQKKALADAITGKKK